MDTIWHSLGWIVLLNSLNSVFYKAEPAVLLTFRESVHLPNSLGLVWPLQIFSTEEGLKLYPCLPPFPALELGMVELTTCCLSELLGD